MLCANTKGIVLNDVFRYARNTVSAQCMYDNVQMHNKSAANQLSLGIETNKNECCNVGNTNDSMTARVCFRCELRSEYCVQFTFHYTDSMRRIVQMATWYHTHIFDDISQEIEKMSTIFACIGLLC